MGAVEIDSAELMAVLKKFDDRASKLTPIMESIATDIVAFVEDQFQSGGGGKWKPLSTAYAKRKAKLGKTSTPLTFDGVWSGSHRAEFDATSAGTSSSVPYAVFHVSKEARKVIPYRSPYDLDDDFISEAAQRIAHYVATGEIT